MKISTTWLNSYLQTKLSTDEIVEALERTEVEIEEVIKPPVLDKKIITAKVMAVKPHPNADKLKLVDIAYGKIKTRVVCGAPNVRVGLTVVYTAPGSTLPDGMKITEREIRGEKSKGMLASGKELGISDDHNGLLELDPDLPLGISLCDIENLGDELDVKTPANRWDMLSVLGLSREISANSPKNQVMDPKLAEIAYKNREVVNVKEIGECPRFISGVVKIDNNVESPAWLVENLQSAGMRAIHPVVDITNFVMLETGQPCHAYDAKKLKGNLQVRFAKAGELLPTLDGVKRKLTKQDLVIADATGAIGLAGVMGGINTEVDEATTEIVLEVASFNKTTIRRSALRHGIRTEASTRFEKGLPLPLPRFGFERATQLLKEICAAKPETAYDQLYGWPWIWHVGLRMRRAEKVLGVSLDEKQIITGLRDRGFGAEHFSLAAEAKKHLGKPYVFGASFKKNGEDCFDCSYLVERIYSKIGISIGHTAEAQFKAGKPVEISDIKPGDLLFYSGHWDKLNSKSRGDIGHVGMYMGNQTVLEASKYSYNLKTKKYVQTKNPGVHYTKLSEYTNNPSFKGARRYIESFNHIIATVAPWWRTDVTTESDLIEEAAKIVGYDNLPNTLPELPPMETSDHQMLPGLMGLREDLVAQGLFEVTTYSFVSEKDLHKTNIDPNSVLAIENPMSHEQAFLRNSIFSSHLQTAARNNSYYLESYGYFELARVYEKNVRATTKTDEAWNLAITAIGQDSLQRVKSILDMFSDRYQLNLQYTRDNKKPFITGRGAKIESKRIIGVKGRYGQIQPMILQSFSISAELSFAEIVLPDQSVFLEPTCKSKPVLPYQLISRDITIEVDNEILWQTIKNEVLASTDVIRTSFLKEFSNDSLQKAGRKKVSLRVWLDCGAQPKQTEITNKNNLLVDKMLSSKELGKAKI